MIYKTYPFYRFLRPNILSTLKQNVFPRVISIGLRITMGTYKSETEVPTKKQKI